MKQNLFLQQDYIQNKIRITKTTHPHAIASRAPIAGDPVTSSPIIAN